MHRRWIFMHRRCLLSLAVWSSALLALGLAQGADASTGYRISDPVVHANLAIYFVRGPSAGGAAPLTLQEAMSRGAVRVHETGNVSELAIENLGDQEIFVQSGDIVKGGKQDRALVASLILPPRSGRVPLASFCVEQGRWSPRGKEDSATFSSADAAVPSREAKLAMKAPAKPTPAGSERAAAAETGDRQQQLWRSVARTQMKLSSGVGQPVAAPASSSSLQLALENQRLKETQAAYIQALKAAGEQHADTVGYVFAINGKLNSADVYPSNGLFRKMWPKLLNASVTEAIGEQGTAAGNLPAAEAVLAFLEAAEAGKPTQKDLNQAVRLETREGTGTLYFATQRASGGWVHRNYLAK
jgi:ARG and Rhodanese-Phosphatase-superfamily-associated Protein domain